MDGENKTPLITGFVSDLMFISRIESAASRLGYEVEWIERAEQLAPPDPDAPRRQLAEHLKGPGAVLLDHLTLTQPALVIFDLGNMAVPWQEWISLIKSVPATRRTPVICFGSHVDVETLQAAKDAGADATLARSRFISDLPNLIEKYAKQPDYEAMQAACSTPLSDLAVQGLEEFNRGEYFESHESLEDAWNEDESVGRELYRAILQVAVAYLQIERRNYKGAMKMFLRMRQWLDPLPDECRGVNVKKLRQDAAQVHEELKRLGPLRIDKFDQRLMRPVEYRQ